MGLLRKALGIATAVVPAFAASQGRLGTAARGLQTGLEIASSLRGGVGAALSAGATSGASGAIASGLMPTTSLPGTVVSPIDSANTPRAVAKRIALNVRIKLQLPKSFSAKTIAKLANRWGFAPTANLLGISEQEVVFVWFAMRSRRRGSRGITARDVRTVQKAGRIIKRVKRLANTFPGGRTGRRAPKRRVGAGSSTSIVNVD